MQKVIELGVDNIFCYPSEKTSDKYNLKNVKEKLERYQDIIESAFLQSENKYLPKLNFINNLFEFSFNDYSDVCVLNQNAKENFPQMINGI